MSAPISGPITRDRFICTDASATAPGQVFARHERRQDRAQPGRAERVRDADREHARPRSARATDASASAIAASPNEKHELRELHADEEPAPVDDVGEQAAERRQEQQRAELREEEQADVDADEPRELAARTRRARRSASTCRCSTRTCRSRRCGSCGAAARPARCPAGTGRRRRRARPRSARARASSSVAPARGHHTDGQASSSARRETFSRSTASVPITCSSRSRASSSSVDAELVAQHLVGVLTERRRGPAPVARGTGRHAHRPRRVLLPADERMLDRLEEAARPHLRIVERRVPRHHRGRGDALRRAARRRRRRPVRAAHHARALVGRHRIGPEVDRDPRVVALRAVHAAGAAPVEQRPVCVVDHPVLLADRLPVGTTVTGSLAE